MQHSKYSMVGDLRDLDLLILDGFLMPTLFLKSFFFILIQVNGLLHSTTYTYKSHLKKTMLVNVSFATHVAKQYSLHE